MPRRPTGWELSLDVIAATLADPSLAGWDGFGLAIQAYQKRASAGDRLCRCHWPRAHDRKLMGAAGQGRLLGPPRSSARRSGGLDGYPVFTRKTMTDLNYVALRAQKTPRLAAPASSRNSPPTTR